MQTTLFKTLRAPDVPGKNTLVVEGHIIGTLGRGGWQGVAATYHPIMEKSQYLILIRLVLLALPNVKVNARLKIPNFPHYSLFCKSV